MTHVGNFLCEEFSFVEVNFVLSFSVSLQVYSQVLVVINNGLVSIVSILNNADPVYPCSIIFAWNALLIPMGNLLFR